LEEFETFKELKRITLRTLEYLQDLNDQLQSKQELMSESEVQYYLGHISLFQLYISKLVASTERELNKLRD
jgi:hypothetical protein